MVGSTFVDVIPWYFLLYLRRCGCLTGGLFLGVAGSTKHTVFGLAVGASTAWVLTVLWLAHDAFNDCLMGMMLANKAGGVGGVVVGLYLSDFA